MGYGIHLTLVPIVLILALVCILIALTSAMQILTSEKFTCILASVRSMSSRLTSIMFIVVIIVSIIIVVLMVLYLYWKNFWFLLRLLTFSSTSGFGLFGLCTLNLFPLYHLNGQYVNIREELLSLWSNWVMQLPVGHIS